MLVALLVGGNRVIWIAAQESQRCSGNASILNHNFSKVKRMPYFCFFVKGNEVIALDKADAAEAIRLTESGFDQQFEEFEASSSENALTRFADIRNEETTTEHAFATGAVFSGIVNAILK